MSYTPMSHSSLPATQAYPHPDPPIIILSQPGPSNLAPEFPPQAQLPNPASVSHPQQVYVVNFNAGNYPPQQLVPPTVTMGPGHWVYVPDAPQATSEQSTDGESARATGGVSDAEERPGSPRPPPPANVFPPSPSDGDVPLPPLSARFSLPPSHPPTARPFRPMALPRSSRPASRPSTRLPSRAPSHAQSRVPSPSRPPSTSLHDLSSESPSSYFPPPNTSQEKRIPTPATPIRAPPSESMLFHLPNLYSSLSSPAPPYGRQSPSPPGYADLVADIGVELEEKRVVASRRSSVRFEAPDGEELQQQGILSGLERVPSSPTHSSLTYATFHEEVRPVDDGDAAEIHIDDLDTIPSVGSRLPFSVQNSIRSWLSDREDGEDEDEDEYMTASSCSLPPTPPPGSPYGMASEALAKVEEGRGDMVQEVQETEIWYNRWDYTAAPLYGWGFCEELEEKGIVKPRVFERLFCEPLPEKAGSDSDSDLSIDVPTTPPSFPYSPSEMSWPSAMSEVVMPDLEDTDDEDTVLGFQAKASTEARIEEARMRSWRAVNEMHKAMQGLGPTMHLPGSMDHMTHTRAMLDELRFLPGLFRRLENRELNMAPGHRPGRTERKWIEARERYLASLSVNLRRVERVAAVFLHEAGLCATSEELSRMTTHALRQMDAFSAKIRSLSMRLDLASIVILRKRLRAVQRGLMDPFKLRNVLAALGPGFELERGLDGLDQRIRDMVRACQRDSP